MKAKISFDCLYGEADWNHFEGCYCLPNDKWQVFYATNRWHYGQPEVLKNAKWQSGITGVNIHYPKDLSLNKSIVKQILADTLGVTEWDEIIGPDSLQLK